MGLKVLAYEGGQHLVGVGGAENNEKLMDLFIAANRAPRMKDIYLEYLRAWKDAGGDMFMIFSSTGAPSKWGSWGILEYQGQDPATAPKDEAVMEALHAARATAPPKGHYTANGSSLPLDQGGSVSDYRQPDAHGTRQKLVVPSPLSLPCRINVIRRNQWPPSSLLLPPWSRAQLLAAR